MKRAFPFPWLVLAVLVGGCAGGPRIDERRPAYWLWHDGTRWQLRATAGGKPHRFQGSIAGVTGSVADAAATDGALRDHVGLVGDAVQFDFESSSGRPGLDARVIGGCARFDLLLDGKRPVDRIHLGDHRRAPPRVPFERCP